MAPSENATPKTARERVVIRHFRKNLVYSDYPPVSSRPNERCDLQGFVTRHVDSAMHERSWTPLLQNNARMEHPRADRLADA